MESGSAAMALQMDTLSHDQAGACGRIAKPRLDFLPCLGSLSRRGLLPHMSLLPHLRGT